MLLSEFFNNPMGKGSSMNIKAIKADYDKRYDLYYKDITIKSFFVGKSIFVTLKIPSSVKGIFYDVVFKFTEQKGSGGASINDMNYQMFSNAPSFLYTYAYVYARHGLLVSETKKMVGKQLQKEKAIMKNPYGVISYDYTIYLALKFIFINGYDSISSLKMIEVKNASTKKVLAEIQDWEDLQVLRKDQKKANKIADEQAKEAKLEEQKRINKVTNKSTIEKVQKVKKVPKVRTIKTIKARRS